MLLKIRRKMLVIHEAFVEIESGLPLEEMLDKAADIADVRDLWRESPNEEGSSAIELIAEYGRIPTIRMDGPPTAQAADYPPEFYED